MPRRSHTTRSRLAALALPAAYVVALLALYGNVFAHTAYFDRDDFTWIGGTTLGNPWRWTQWVLLHQICLPLTGADRAGYYLPSLALHLIDALLVAHVGRLLAEAGGSARDRGRARLTGALAGFVFLLYGSGAPRWISAQSYQLVVLFALLMLVGVLHHERSRRVGWWVLAVGAYALALASHSYAILLPGFALLLVWVVGRGRERARGAWPTAVRVGALLLPLAVFLWRYGDGLLRRAGEVSSAHAGGSSALQFLKYLWVTVLQFWGSPYRAYEVELRWDAWGIGGAIALAAVVALGGVQLLRERGQLRAWGMLLLFGVAWNGLAIAQTLATAHNLSSGWRYYFNAVGFALVVAHLLVAGLDAVVRRLPAVPRTAGVAAPLVLLCAGVLVAKLADERLFDFWARAAAGQISFDQRLWDAGHLCDGRTRLTEDGARRRLGAGEDLRCVQLRNRTLPDIDLSGVDLGGSDLTASDLTGAVLRGADLRGAGLVWADLAGADLTGADLTHTNLSGADLSYADLRGARLDQTVLNGAVLVGSLHEPEALAHTHLCNADIRGLDLAGYRLGGVAMRETLVHDTVFRDAELAGADLTKADGQGVDLRGADLRDALMRRVYLPGADLRGADLRGVDLTWGYLAGADLTGADLRRADLTGTDLTDAVLIDADLRGARSGQAMLDRAVLDGAKWVKR